MDQNYASHEEEPPFENENNKLPKIPILTIPIVPDNLQLVLHVDIFLRNWISREKDIIYIYNNIIYVLYMLDKSTLFSKYGYKTNQASEKFASTTPKKHDRKQLKTPHRTNMNLFFSCACI